MILRKPYAFLIKHFQKIHFILLLLASFILYKHLSFLGMVREYITTKYYNPILQPMSMYTSVWFYLGIIFIIGISSVLIYLLYYKKKPVVSYFLIILEYLAVLFAFLFGAAYFNEVGLNAIQLQRILLVRDILFIVSIPQYIILILLLIRSMGLDLKKFGFREDEEYLDIEEEDREEFELEVGFDLHKIKRIGRKKVRFFRYFFLEHKFILLSLIGAGIVFTVYFSYQHFFVANRAYRMGEEFVANSYRLKMNHLYFTDKDYAGNIISKEGKKYIVLDFSVTNITNQDLVLDTHKFILTGRRNYYVPVQTHDQYFTDLGIGYQNQTLHPQEENRYLLIYEIKAVDFGSYYMLFYQEVHGANQLHLRRIITDLIDLSNPLEEDSSLLGEKMELEFYNQSKQDVLISHYLVSKELSYLYTSCYVWDCRVYEGTLKETPASTLLRLQFQGEEKGLSFQKFLLKHARIVYTVQEETKTSILKSPLSREWKGNYAYLFVPKEVENASFIALEFIVRDHVYSYILKGDEAK